MVPNPKLYDHFYIKFDNYVASYEIIQLPYHKLRLENKYFNYSRK